MINDLEKFESWTEEKCRKEAMKYETRNAFCLGSPKAYGSMRTHNWWHLCDHMIEVQKPTGHWNDKENCRQEASKYETKIDVRKGSSGAFHAIAKFGWMNEFFPNAKKVKSNGYWNNKELCKQEALKYKNRNEFSKNSTPAYQSMHRNGWVEEFTSHMEKDVMLPGYWTKEKCKDEALKFISKEEYRKGSTSYVAASRNKWLEEICQHMIKQERPCGYWTMERCKEEALKFTKRNDFRKELPGAYKATKVNKWDKYVFSHMRELPPKTIYTFDLCKKISSQYNLKSEFMKYNRTAYNRIMRNKWNTLLDHMFIEHEEQRDRLIYLYTFPENYVYIGLTYDIQKRKNGHHSKRKGIIYKHMQKTGHKPVVTLLKNYMPVAEAKKEEGILIEEYRNKGYTVLNTAKAGGIGGIKNNLTYQICKEACYLCNDKKELKLKNEPLWTEVQSFEGRTESPLS